MPVAIAITDANGEYRFDVPDGEYCVWRNDYLIPGFVATTTNRYVAAMGTGFDFGYAPVVMSAEEAVNVAMVLSQWDALGIDPEKDGLNWWIGQAQFDAIKAIQEFRLANGLEDF